MRTWAKRKPSNWLDEALPIAAMPQVWLTLVALGIGFAISYDAETKYSPGRQRECAANLELMRAAVQRWADEHQRVAGDTIAQAEVLSYFKGSRLPTCPGDGSYLLPRTVGELPTCSIPGHVVHK